MHCWRVRTLNQNLSKLLSFLGIGPLGMRSWGLLDVLGGVPGAGSSLGAGTKEGLGGVPGAGSCLFVISGDAMVVVMNWV